MQSNRPARSWTVTFQQIAERALGKEAGKQLWEKYESAFPIGYQTLVSPRYALKDLLHLEQLTHAKHHDISLLKPYQGITHYRLHFYSQQEHFLDEYIPVLENMHLRVLDQVQFPFTVNGNTQFIRSFTIKTATNQCPPLGSVNHKLLNTIRVILDGKSENDALNKLLVLTGMNWQEIDVLRAYRNYYLQLGHQTTRASVNHALINNPQVALCLFNKFEARFRPNPEWDDPVIREEQALFPLRLKLLESMESVSDINEDRILRTLFILISATMRCNFHLRRNLDDYFIAFKINSLGVINMPSPKPQNEIYVHAVDMEGIHLRGGKVSRGGIRWSDRSDDFRSEILGLMQTQISKNALIIPTGAKGGFILKKKGLKFSSANSTLEKKDAGKKAYITLIRGLLDLTDNYCDDKVVRLPNIVSYDDPDPYLVVAADKGTASFSDLANGVSADYQFWLGDAFASGGSRGYDHKALGITARGAWECVQRHFREIGKDIQNESFTVVGIGSMDGDVFGNGLLLSPCIRLLAAFSGQHIFIDPDPSATDTPFNERKRLFELPGSSWNDYDRTLISNGGGVYFRSDKDIPVSAELKKWLGIRYKSLDGESLIRYLLTAKVDLLWLGGIGTYVKASTEKHEEVGDRSNDNVRVDAANLGATVVGEGANLGFTQKARIEYGLRGGRINTDAVDNSAGVDASDHEVNLKILLTGLQKKQLISDYQPLFISMTGNVCEQVLANNYVQSLCLSLDQLRSAGNPAVFLQLADRLEAVGFLDRIVESFPQTKAILSRPGQTITRPELAVLMASSKMYLTQQIENQVALLHDECCECYLQSYFPDLINKYYKNELSAHPLASEIKATTVSNKIINQAGCSFLSLDSDSENANILDHVGCYLTFDRVLEADALRQAVYALDNDITADSQYHCLLELEKTLAGFCRWALLNNKKMRPDAKTINCYSQYLKDFERYYSQQYSVQFIEQMESYQQKGFSEALAKKIVFISSLDDFPFIVSLSAETSTDFVTVFKLLNEITQYLGLYEIYGQLAKLPSHDYWEQKVLSDIEADIKRVIGLLLNTMLLSKSSSCADYFDLPSEKQKINRYRRIYQEIKTVSPVNLIPYIALTKELEKLVA
ncbi:MAG: NAD-glutamate dehydrogenase [Methylococcales bacterium]|nr:NAD-glutamate dehydrogenase [Methylococcales bacterium]MDD5630438.1 NAD-glutamate dehydrogenase [Methylococcales bacterium]